MHEYCIELIGKRRSDGTVCITSNDIPLFSVVGDSEEGALELALRLLPHYLKANVPEFVELRPVGNASQLFSNRSVDVLPAHVIARTEKGQSGDHRRKTA